MTAINTLGIIRRLTDTQDKPFNVDVRLFLIWMIYWGDAMRLILLLFAERLLRYMDKKIKASDELASTNDNEPP